VYWACAQLQPQRERLALHCLQQVAGFTTYCPRIRMRSNADHGRHSKAAHARLLRPLFPGYCFVLLVNGTWWGARWQPGVTRIVLDGGVPARVPASVIADLRSRERDGVVILPEQQLRRGDPVRIVRGPFRDQFALFAGMRPKQRVEVLLSLLGGHQRVTLARDAVEAL
jgi:transcription antitermination factor NusG